MDYDELVRRSRVLSYRMPTHANRLSEMADRRNEVEEHVAGVRPILHEKLVGLIDEFLAFKRERGSPVERGLYKEMDAISFVSRLLVRRPLAFLTSSDSYTLRDGTSGRGGFDSVGAADERAPLLLRDRLSYDEMPISAMLGVSVPTHFINSGARTNMAMPDQPGSFERRGVYVGLLGARFERAERMEWRHIMVTRSQNVPANGYGRAPRKYHPPRKHWS